ncbi:Uncharacterised protein [Mycobacterium tuberculosis]|uniref:Uncharacterized protein n=1 Tax=Mycobacterium tuberculosis TaxID=1773 RepID=A0A0U0RT54_MYCTX|nr:Uncharacterised protein [Mycobacterium tuberculosis]COW23275.1 Uncharacterised protein [Mycobacterium tuberculosis]
MLYLSEVPLARPARRSIVSAPRGQSGCLLVRTVRTVVLGARLPRVRSPGCDRLRMTGQPEHGELTHAVLEPADPDRGGGHRETAAFGER